MVPPPLSPDRRNAAVDDPFAPLVETRDCIEDKSAVELGADAVHPPTPDPHTQVKMKKMYLLCSEPRRPASEPRPAAATTGGGSGASEPPAAATTTEAGCGSDGSGGDAAATRRRRRRGGGFEIDVTPTSFQSVVRMFQRLSEDAEPLVPSRIWRPLAVPPSCEEECCAAAGCQRLCDAASTNVDAGEDRNDWRSREPRDGDSGGSGPKSWDDGGGSFRVRAEEDPRGANEHEPRDAGGSGPKPRCNVGASFDVPAEEHRTGAKRHEPQDNSGGPSRARDRVLSDAESGGGRRTVERAGGHAPLPVSASNNGARRAQIEDRSGDASGSAVKRGAAAKEPERWKAEESKSKRSADPASVAVVGRVDAEGPVVRPVADGTNAPIAPPLLSDGRVGTTECVRVEAVLLDEFNEEAFGAPDLNAAAERERLEGSRECACAVM